MAKLTIDGKDYDTDTFSNEAKAALNALQFTEVEIQRHQAKLAAMQTARQVYVNALKTNLEKTSSSTSESFKFASDTIQFG